MIHELFPLEGGPFQIITALQNAGRFVEKIAGLLVAGNEGNIGLQGLGGLLVLVQPGPQGVGLFVPGIAPVTVAAVVINEGLPFLQGFRVIAEVIQAEALEIMGGAVVVGGGIQVTGEGVQGQAVLTGVIIHNAAVEIGDGDAGIHQGHQAGIAVVGFGVVGDRVLEAGVGLIGQAEGQIGLTGEEVHLGLEVIIRGGFIDGHEFTHGVDVVALGGVGAANFDIQRLHGSGGGGGCLGSLEGRNRPNGVARFEQGVADALLDEGIQHGGTQGEVLAVGGDGGGGVVLGAVAFGQQEEGVGARGTVGVLFGNSGQRLHGGDAVSI